MKWHLAWRVVLGLLLLAWIPFGVAELLHKLSGWNYYRDAPLVPRRLRGSLLRTRDSSQFRKNCGERLLEVLVAVPLENGRLGRISYLHCGQPLSGEFDLGPFEFCAILKRCIQLHG